MDELVGTVGEEGLGETVGAGRDREAAVAVIGVDDGHDLALLRRVARAFDREVDRLGAARRVHRVLHAAAADLGQLLSQRRAPQSREMVVAHVEPRGAAVQHLDQLGMAMADIVGAAVQVHVDQAATVHVEEQVAFAPVNDEIDLLVLPELGLVRIPELLRFLDEFLFSPGSAHAVPSGPHAKRER